MKRVISGFLTIICLISFANPIFATTNSETENNNIHPIISEQSDKLEAKGVILMSLQNGEILYSRDEDKKLYPASTTKILTGLLAIEYGELDEMVKVGNEANLCSSDSSLASLDIGEEIDLKKLLYGLMLPSGNDAAYSIAVYIGRKTKKDPSLPIKEAVQVFVDLMNTRAKEIGAENSHFVTPDGYHDDNHYTTVRDMALITREAMKHPVFREIVATERYSMPDWASSQNSSSGEAQTRHWINSNMLIQAKNKYHYDGANGVKTGFTSKAQHCLVTSALRDGVELLSVVYGSTRTGKWTDTTALLNYGFDNFEMYKPVDQGQQIEILNVEGDPNNWVRVIAKNTSIQLIPKSAKDKIHHDIMWDPEITQSKREGNIRISLSAPFSQSQKVGTIVIKLDDEVLDKIDLITSRGISGEGQQRSLVKIGQKQDTSYFGFWHKIGPLKKAALGIIALFLLYTFNIFGYIKRKKRQYLFRK